MTRVPYYLERFMAFGLGVCVCSYLTVFTLVPLKLVVQLVKLLWARITGVRTRPPDSLRHDATTLVTIGGALYLLNVVVGLDISRMYHDIRGQAHIKLYVMFGVLEVADKLLLSLGQDVLDLLYCRDNSKLRRVVVAALAIVYLAFHAYVLVYQTVSLNVAANSYSNALMTLLLSNQFAELKGSVFKRFEREGLFQVALADLCERYSLGLMILIIASRNLLQLTRMGLDSWELLIPNSWLLAWNNLVGGAIIGPAIGVFGLEIIVDWLKHCYITKFNKLRPQVYRNFLTVISADYILSMGDGDSHDLTDYLVHMRRIGIPLYALIVCLLLMTMGDLKYVLLPVRGTSFKAVTANSVVILLVFLALVLIRLILGLVLLKLAVSIVNRRQVENVIFPGVPNPEMSTINPTSRHLLYDPTEPVPPGNEEKLRRRDRETDLDSVMRFKMSSKRIW